MKVSRGRQYPALMAPMAQDTGVGLMSILTKGIPTLAWTWKGKNTALRRKKARKELEYTVLL